MSAVRRYTLATAFAVLCSLAGSVAATSQAARSCGTSGYAYAGLAGNDRVYGLAAKLTTLSAPHVLAGHVAGWVGVGGVGAGPDGTNEWIQVGFSGFPGTSTSSLYYEVAQPNQAPAYHEIESDIPTGTTKKVAVLEMPEHDGWWRVWVDDRAVSDPVHLPGSHGAWRPIATAETWGAGSFVCNRFRYAFRALSVATRAGGTWLPLRHPYTFEDHGYRITRSPTNTYVASSG